MARRIIKCSPQTVIVRKKKPNGNVPKTVLAREKRKATQKNGERIFYGDIDELSGNQPPISDQLYSGTRKPNRGVYGKDSPYKP